MAEDWALDVKKYASDADDTVIAAIVRYCGIALRSRDASLVSFSDPVETDRVRENYCKKKLGLTDSDETLDGAIAAVGQRMSGDATRNRVTVYYLLAEHFGKLGLFGASSDPVVEEPAFVPPPAATPVAVAPVAAAPLLSAYESTPESAGESKRGVAATGWGDYLPLALLVVGGIGILSLLGRKEAPVAPVPAPVAVEVPVVAVPTGAGVVAALVEDEPMVSVYFDTAKSDIDPSFEATTAELRAYAASHPGDHLQVSGFNDPRGDAAFNAELSKNRAFAVRDALAALGISITTIALVKPAETTKSDVSMANARRVDVTVEDGPVPAAEVEPAPAAAEAAPAAPPAP